MRSKMQNVPICVECDHFILNKKHNLCKAFPKPPGIPWEIVSGENDHSKPLPEQGNNITFKPKKKKKKEA